MMKLYFLRHGLAGDRQDWKGDDSARPLTKEGKARMAREAKTIARMELKLDLIITSPLVRARQTAEIVAEEMRMLDKLVEDDRVGIQFGIDPLKKILQAHSKASALMLVGHEPSFSETISHLIGGGRIDCKKGSLACVNLSNVSSLRGELVWLLPPKTLAR